MKKLLPDLIEINEAFDTHFEKLEWAAEKNDRQVAHASIDGIDFILYIEPSLVMVGSSRHVFLNIAFSRIVDGKPTELLIGTGENQNRIFGAVVNALKAKIKELDGQFDISALTMMAVAAEEKRLALYTRIMKSRNYGLWPWTYRASVKSEDGTAIIATKKDLSKAEFDALEADIASRGKALIKQ